MEVGELFVSGYFGGAGDFSSEIIMTEAKTGENFTVDDLLDFSNEDGRTSDGSLDNIAGNSAESSSVTGNSYVSGENHSSSANFTGSRSFSADYHFSGELSIPYDDVAQLEWLSNFVEESFSTDQKIQNLQSKVHIFSGSGSKSSTASSRPPTSSPTISNSIFQSDASVPGKVRSKRPRAAPGDWTTRLFHLTPKAAAQPKKRQISKSETELSGRKCLHCQAEKTPQWRTGPMGPKTLCNACGVQYKSGRLVPEYRPAASPSFVLTKHSNSHRKVLELRKQKVMQLEAGQQLPFLGQSSVFGAPS